MSRRGAWISGAADHRTDPHVDWRSGGSGDQFGRREEHWPIGFPVSPRAGSADLCDDLAVPTMLSDLRGWQ
jgi:hypothetical protein